MQNRCFDEKTLVSIISVGRDSIEPILERSEANGVSIFFRTSSPRCSPCSHRLGR